MNTNSLALTRSRPTVSVPLAALLAGATLAVGAIALPDTDAPASPAAKANVIELRGSKASATGVTSPSPETSLGGPRGLPSSLSSR